MSYQRSGHALNGSSPNGSRSKQSHQNPTNLSGTQVRSRTTGLTPSALLALAVNDDVMVNLHARGWVMGVILCTLQFFEAINGWGYRVRFTMPGDTIPTEDTVPADNSHIRLQNHHGQ